MTGWVASGFQKDNSEILKITFLKSGSLRDQSKWSIQIQPIGSCNLGCSRIGLCFFSSLILFSALVSLMFFIFSMIDFVGTILFDSCLIYKLFIFHKKLKLRRVYFHNIPKLMLKSELKKSAHVQKLAISKSSTIFIYSS